MDWASFIGWVGAIIAITTGFWFVWDKIKPAFTKTGKWLIEVYRNIRDTRLSRKTYYRYRTMHTPLIDSNEIIYQLEARYECVAFRFAGHVFPVTVIWQNSDRQIRPDKILGELDKTQHDALPNSSLLNVRTYKKARKYIERKFTAGPIKYEGRNYLMTQIDLSGNLPKIHGAIGLYYDNILTQYAMEWELKKALRKNDSRVIQSLSALGTLPLRESIESKGNPLYNGTTRCAAITISTLLVFNRRQQGFHCLMHRRSAKVGVSPNMMHVVPAGMFELKNRMDNWSVEMNVWRELLEEVYNVAEQQGTGVDELPDYVLNQEPIRSLTSMMKKGSAQLSVTGIVCDLLNLRPEICTVLFVKDPDFASKEKMNLNWEYIDKVDYGTGAVPWQDIDRVTKTTVEKHAFVASGAACLGLGREWIRVQHGM